MSLAQVEGFSSLRKDTASGGVINVDKRSYEAHRAQKIAAIRNINQQKAAQESVEKLQNEINTIKTDLVDIRTMLAQLLQKGN